ncbi:MAG: helix-turn-helix domain-containing protein [Candidatus Lokiarchaeota archaeon]|nr:helix-turn-helix domain-containing protein [Candidatus Harpocratesius repetitus]
MTQQQKQERDDKIREFIAEGMTVAQIVKAVGCSNSTVLRLTPKKHNKNMSNITDEKYKKLLQGMFDFFVKNRDNLDFDEKDIELIKKVQEVLNQ